jgi:hypothetical protein
MSKRVVTEIIDKPQRRLRLAAVQISYLPSLISVTKDYVAEPFTERAVPGNDVGAELQLWRQRLRKAYADTFAWKLHRIIDWCVEARCHLSE